MNKLLLLLLFAIAQGSVLQGCAALAGGAAGAAVYGASEAADEDEEID